jgi:hypothetical protein
VALPVRATGLPLGFIADAAGLGASMQNNAANVALGAVQEARLAEEARMRGQEVQRPFHIETVVLPGGQQANQAYFMNPDGTVRAETLPGTIPADAPAPYRTTQNVLRNGVPTSVLFELGPNGLQEVPLGAVPQTPQEPRLPPEPMVREVVGPDGKVQLWERDRTTGNWRPAQGPQGQALQAPQTSAGGQTLNSQLASQGTIATRMGQQLLLRLQNDLSLPKETRDKVTQTLNDSAATGQTPTLVSILGNLPPARRAQFNQAVARASQRAAAEPARAIEIADEELDSVMGGGGGAGAGAMDPAEAAFQQLLSKGKGKGK